MSSVFRHLTLNRIGAASFLVGILLLVAGAAGAVVSAASGNSAALSVAGVSGGQAALLGLGFLAASAVVFALAITHERLARLEAKLDALARRRPAGGPEDAAPAEPVAAADRGRR